MPVRSITKLFLDRLRDDTPWRFHQIGAKPEHEHTELHLIQRAVSIEIPFVDHAPYVVVRQISEPENRRRVTPQVLESDDSSVSVHEKLEPFAELFDQTFSSEVSGHRGEEIVEVGFLVLLGRSGWWFRRRHLSRRNWELSREIDCFGEMG